MNFKNNNMGNAGVSLEQQQWLKNKGNERLNLKRTHEDTMKQTTPDGNGNPTACFKIMNGQLHGVQSKMMGQLYMKLKPSMFGTEKGFIHHMPMTSAPRKLSRN